MVLVQCFTSENVQVVTNGAGIFAFISMRVLGVQYIPKFRLSFDGPVKVLRFGTICHCELNRKAFAPKRCKNAMVDDNVLPQ